MTDGGQLFESEVMQRQQMKSLLFDIFMVAPEERGSQFTFAESLGGVTIF